MNRKEQYLKQKRNRRIINNIILGVTCTAVAGAGIFYFVNNSAKVEEPATIGELITNNTIDDTKFTPKFIDGVTEAVPINNIDVELEPDYVWRTDPSAEGLKLTSYESVLGWSGWNDCRVFDLRDTTLWGNIGMRYNNVGEYNGSIVDMMISFNGSSQMNDDLAPFTGFDTATDNIPLLAMDTTTFHYYLFTDTLLNPSVTITFYEHGTENTLVLDGLLVWRDVDQLEKLTVILPNEDSIFLHENTNLNIELENNVAKVTSTEYNALVTDELNWIVFNFQGDSLTFNHTFEDEVNHFDNYTTERHALGGGMCSEGIFANSIQEFLEYK